MKIPCTYLGCSGVVQVWKDSCWRVYCPKCKYHELPIKSRSEVLKRWYKFTKVLPIIVLSETEAEIKS
jgi:hypothetical protein